MGAFCLPPSILSSSASTFLRRHFWSYRFDSLPTRTCSHPTPPHPSPLSPDQEPQPSAPDRHNTAPPSQGASVAGASCQATPATSLRRFKVGYSNGAAAQLKPGGGGLLPSDGVGGGRGGLVSNGPKQISLTDACSVSERSMQCNSMHCSTAC